LNLSAFWGFVAGATVMSCLWIWATHVALTCPQKSLLIMFTVLASVSLAIALTLRKEAGRGSTHEVGKEYEFEKDWH